MLGFDEKIGIGGKLFIAFGLTLILIAAAAILGWLGFGQVASKQKDVINRAIPAMTEAQQLAEISANLNAMTPVLATTISEKRYADFHTTIEEQKSRLKVLLKETELYGFDPATIKSLRFTVDQITTNLSQQSEFVAQRIEVEKKRNFVISKMESATKEITELSGTLVANAASGTTAVASNMYDLLENSQNSSRYNPGNNPEIFDALDRLIEVDLDSMERMFELRLSSSILNAILAQLGREPDLSKIPSLHKRFLNLLKIITRRISEINDPTRQHLARNNLNKLVKHAAPDNKENVFTLQRRRLMLFNSLEQLHAEGLEAAAALNTIVGDMIKEGSDTINRSTFEVEQAVTTGKLTAITTAIFSLICIYFFLWFYLQKKVVHRLVELKSAMNELANGNYNVTVDLEGKDELSSMANTIQFFKENAISKERLEKVQVEIEKELRRHKSNLEKIVAERTEQLRTTNKKLETESLEHIKARNIAEKANRAKTDFFATMSHELRTPMSGLLGTVNLLANTDLSPKQKQYTDIVNSAGEGLLELLNDLLEFSQIEGGKLELGHINFNLQQLISNMVMLMQASVVKKGITLKSDIAPDVPLYLNGDPGKLRQILLNLIGNAIKFTHDGYISVIVKQLDRTETQAQLLFEVKDTGIGIPLENQASVFEPFTQVNSTISRQYGGIGLGLAICKRFIHAMGGKINCKSEKGAGTTISFFLPVLIGEDDKLPDSSLPAYEEQLSELNVLLVEDDEVTSMVVNTYLEKIGCEVTSASEGFEAVELAGKDDFDVILMDISLPGKDGLQVTREIRELANHNANIPVIAMSAHVFKEEVRQYLDAGMDGFLGKPIDPARLNSVIYQVVYENDKPVSLPASRNSLEQETSCRDALMEDVRVIGLDRTRELVELFFSTSQQTLDELKNNIEQKDNSAISENAHKLKGAASSVGLNLLYKCAMEIETNAHQKKDGIQQPFEHLRLVYQESCHLLKRVFDGISQQQKAS